jgi:hypothetical protein
MMKCVLIPAVAVLCCALTPSASNAQSNERRFEVGAHAALAGSDQFDETDTGVGARFAWLPWRALGAEAEVSFYPSDFPDDVAFSRARWEGFFGATVGPRFGFVRPFAKLRPGFLTYSEAPAPFACIAIFPPPLQCTLGGGSTVFALDLGGGVDLQIAGRTFFRLDVSDRMLRYEGPVFDLTRTIHEESFWSHGLRVALGGGLRF